ncbi:MAG: ShlB/FhaC/HecB family hemolysin secretion/activation protein, partial [Alphaproteobacteria bacterium]
FVDTVVVEGDVGRSQSLIERYVANITESRPVHIRDVERYLLLVNDLPGIRGVGVLRPSGAEVGAAELVVTVERKAFDGFVLWDNRGSQFTGHQGVAVDAAANSFTPFGERTEVTLFTALDKDEQLIGQIAYQQQIGSEGLTVNGVASYGESEPGGSLEPLDIESETLLLGVGARYPIIRSRRLNLSVSGGFEYVDQDSDIAGSTPLVRDSLRVIHTTARVDLRDSFGGANFATFGIRQGLPILSASDDGDANLSRVEGQGTFTSLNGEVARLQRIVDNLNVLADLSGQYAFQELLSGEECEIGGLTFGRGYDPSELTGEHCFGATIELQYNQTFDLPVLQSVQFYGFYDFGVVFNTDSNTDDSESLASAGGGIRTNVTDWLSADFEVAQPLTKEIDGRDDNKNGTRYFFRLTGRF